MPKLLKWLLGIIGFLLVAAIGLAWWFIRPAWSVDVNHPPQFVTHNIINLDSIASISKFRSGAGHDYSSNGETCRSMKHYFVPPYTAAVAKVQEEIKSGVGVPAPAPGRSIVISAPMEGVVTQLADEHIPEGKQLWLRSTANPAWTVIIFHVYPASDLHFGSHVAAGQTLGTINLGQETDIAVRAFTFHGSKLVSFFQVMTDKVFAEYQARGIQSRDQLIISKADRDAHPLQCQGQEFTTQEIMDPLGAEVYLTGYSFQEEQAKQNANNQENGPQQFGQLGSGQTSFPGDGGYASPPASPFR